MLPTPRKPKVTCERKVRYPDEIVARASASLNLEKFTEIAELFVYKCEVCRGFHLTRFPKGTSIRGDNPVYEASPEEKMLQVIGRGSFSTHITASAPDLKQKHELCLKLEEAGKIRRALITPFKIVWKAKYD